MPVLDWDKAYRSARKFSSLTTQECDELLAFVYGELPEIRIANAVDLGCGTGDLLLALAKRGINTVGIDSSAVALEEAAVRMQSLQKHPGGPRIFLEKFDLEELDDYQPQMRPEIVFCKLVIAFVEKKQMMVDAIARMLAEHGVFVLITPVYYEDSSPSKRLLNIGVPRGKLQKILEHAFSRVVLWRQKEIQGEVGEEVILVCFK